MSETLNNKELEGIGVFYALMTGKCDNCPYLFRCEHNDDFKFPADAACTIQTAELREVQP